MPSVHSSYTKGVPSSAVPAENKCFCSHFTDTKQLQSSQTFSKNFKRRKCTPAYYYELCGVTFFSSWVISEIFLSFGGITFFSNPPHTFVYHHTLLSCSKRSLLHMNSFCWIHFFVKPPFFRQKIECNSVSLWLMGGGPKPITMGQ